MFKNRLISAAADRVNVVEKLEIRRLLAANDPNDQIDEAEEGGVTNWSINPASDVDLRYFDANADDIWEINVDTPNSELDSFLRIFDADGFEVASNDDQGSGGGFDFLDSFIRYTVQSSGRYYVGVSANGNEDYSIVTGSGDEAGFTTGSFDLRINRTFAGGNDPNDQISEAEEGGVTNWSINPGSDVDMRFFRGVAGEVWAIDVDTNSGIGGLDSYLRIFDSSGNELAANDDQLAPGDPFNANSLDSYLEYQLPFSGNFYVGVSDLANDEYDPITGNGDRSFGRTGSFDLRLERLSSTPDSNDQISEASDSSVDNWSINPDSDVDMLRFNASSGERWAIDFDRRSGNLDGFLRVFDSSGTTLISNNNAAAPGEGSGTDSYIEFVAPFSGTFYVGVSDAANTSYNPITGNGDQGAGRTGTYDVRINRLNVVDNDPNDQISEANSGTVSGWNINPASDVDMLTFFASAGETWDIELDDRGFAGILRLFSSGGEELSQTTSDFIAFTAPSTGNYFVGVSGNGNDNYNPVTGQGDSTNASRTGTFDLDISRRTIVDDDPNDQISEANPGSVFGWNINPASDVDMLSFFAQAGETYRLDLDDQGFAGIIRLFTQRGEQLDISYSDTLAYSFSSSGTYYVGISGNGNDNYNAVTGTGDSVNGGSTGRFDLEINQIFVDNDPNDQISEANPGGVNNWSINPATDVDMLSFFASANEVWEINIDEQGFFAELRLFDAAGNELDASGFFIQFTAPTTATYYVGVSGNGNVDYDPITGLGDTAPFGSDTGSYDVTIDRLQVAFDDPNDQISEANLGGANNWSIDPSSDVDMFRFDAGAGDLWAIDVDGRAGNLDSYVRLFDASGTELASNDNGQAPGEPFDFDDSYLEFRTPSAGSYYVGVSSWRNRSYDPIEGDEDRIGGDTGSFDLRLERLAVNDDSNDEIGEANAGGQNGFTIDPADDVDMFSFSAQVGEVWGLDVDRVGGNLDSLLRVFDRFGNQIASNDNGAAPGEPQGVDSYLEFSPQSTGTYYVGVSSRNNDSYDAENGTGDVDGGSTGTFNLSLQVVRTINDDNNDQISEAGGLPNSGTIDSPTDVDMFFFDASAGERFGIDLDIISETAGGFGPLIRLFDSSGNELDDDSFQRAPGESDGDGYIDYFFTTSGRFYVGVSHELNDAYDALTGVGDEDYISDVNFQYALSVTRL
jgi:hypothetical protein